MKGTNFLICLAGLMTVVGCRQKPLGPDVSSVPVSVRIVRTEDKLAGIRTKEDIGMLMREHPAFYSLYFREVFPGYGGQDLDSLTGLIRESMADTAFANVLGLTQKKYRDLTDIKGRLEDFFRHWKYYFPDKRQIPDFYTFVSGFGYQAFIFEDDGGRDGIAIGLDMFLDPDFNYKTVDPDNNNFSDYITRTWNRDHIAKKVADIYVNDLIGEPPGHRMIDLMIHNGKALYITQLLMPAEQDTVIMEYTADQLDWCREHELQMWSYFVSEKLFYETSLARMGKYINPSPSSPNMPPEAPGRTANYVGWQIVRAYMERHPETTVRQLIEFKDSQQFLDASKYKPRQK